MKINFQTHFINVCSGQGSIKLLGIKELLTGKTALSKLTFDVCLECCRLEMSAIPQGVFAAHKVKTNMNKSYIITAMTKFEEKKKSERPKASQYPRLGQVVREYSPLKYNSKLMNSIWGLYNRYSVHNFKKNTDANNMITAGGYFNEVSPVPGTTN